MTVDRGKYRDLITPWEDGAWRSEAPARLEDALAVDAVRGWPLLPDGGELFRDVLDSGRADARSWGEALRQYAALQRAVAALPPLAVSALPVFPQGLGFFVQWPRLIVQIDRFAGG